MQREWPFVGRASELRRIVALLSLHQPRGVVLAGPAGVGKTRLALECLAQAEKAGYATARATATRSAAELPLGALAPLLPARHHGQTGGVDDRGDLLRRSASALVRLGGDRRLILLVDDAHLLDPVSATLIHELAASRAAAVLLTVRTDETTPEPVVALWEDDLAERVEVGGLGIGAIERLLSPALGGPVDQAAVAELARLCEGNVLFLREIVLGAIGDGTLHDEGGIWRLARGRAPSERLVELVEIRLAGLSADERALLELVAFAEVVGPAELEILGPGVWTLTDSLERKALLSAQTQGARFEVRPAHPLYGEVLRDRLPAVRARALARALADAVEAVGAARREDTLRLATWRLYGGGDRPELMLEAASIARWRYDFPLAERLTRAALEQGAGFDARLHLAQLAGLQGRGEQAAADLAALAACAADDVQRGTVAIARLDNLAFYLGHPQEAVEIAEEAEATIADPVWQDDLASRRVALVGMIAGPRAAVQIAEPLLQRVSGRAMVWAALPACLELGRLGQVATALEVSGKGYAAHLTLTQPLEWHPWMHLFVRCQALARAGRLAEAQELANEQYQKALVERSPEAQAWFAWHLTSVVEVQGNVTESTDRGREAVALFRQLGRPQFTYITRVCLTMALALGGRAREAQQSLQKLDELGLRATNLLGVDPLQARAWTAVAAGDLQTGCTLLREAATLGEEVGDLTGAAAALHGLARLGRAREVAARLAILSEAVEGCLAPAQSAHTDALAARDPEALGSVAETFAEMGADLLAAEAAADAAVAWQRAGSSRQRTSTAQVRARVLADRCPGARTPALQSAGARAKLTPAEYEAVVLAAAGRSNKEIAERLDLSVRSVEGRLLRAFPKIGVTSRAELVAALGATELGSRIGDKP